MPKVVIAPDFGEPEVVSIAELPTPDPGPDQVVIRVRAAAVNPSDLKLLRGQFGRSMRLPLRLGSEVSGVVAAVGPSVTTVGPGDEVIAYRVSGGLAEEVVTASANVFLKPASVSFEQGAGLLLAGVTAVHLLTAASVSKGDVVVIHGASGSVGLTALQLAVARGARVIGTAGAARLDLVARYGAEPVTYGDGLLERLQRILPRGADAALDTVGTDEAIDASLALVADRSRIASVAAFRRGPELGIRLLGAGAGADPGDELRSASRQGLVDAAGRGELTVQVGSTFPLTAAAAALALAGSGHSDGKVIVLP